MRVLETYSVMPINKKNKKLCKNKLREFAQHIRFQETNKPKFFLNFIIFLNLFIHYPKKFYEIIYQIPYIKSKISLQHITNRNILF